MKRDHLPLYKVAEVAECSEMAANDLLRAGWTLLAVSPSKIGRTRFLLGISRSRRPSELGQESPRSDESKPEGTETLPRQAAPEAGATLKQEGNPLE